MVKISALPERDLDGTENIVVEKDGVTGRGRLPLGVEPPESEWALRVGTDGGPAVGFMRDGRVIGQVDIPDIPDITEEALESEWALRLGTNGGPSVGFRRDGRVIGIFEAPPFDLASAIFTTPTGPRKLMPSPQIVALGDSTAEGAGASGSANAWRTLLGDALGITVVNKGIGGSNAEQIAARYGAVPTIVTVTGNSIPASGSASITAIAPVILYNGGSASTRTISGTIGGSPVRITAVSPAQTYTIEQLGTPSGALAVPAGSVFLPDDGHTVYQDSTLIVCSGTNNAAGDPYAAVEQIKAIAYRNRPYFKRVFVVSPRNNRVSGRPGTAAYDNILTMNRLLAHYFGDNYLDLRSFLIRDGLGVLGLTPTAQDLTDMNDGCIPEQIMADGLHSNNIGHQAEAWFFERVLRTRGFA